MPRRHPAGLVLVLAGMLTLAACGDTDDPKEEGSTDRDELSIDLEGPSGEPAGTVEVEDEGGEGTKVSVDVRGLEPGYHGFHVHTTGKCEPDSADPEDPKTTGDFLSAGGHLSEEGSSHGQHKGDMPSVDVGDDGAGTLEVTTHRFSLADLEDDDGSAFMVHAGPDNFANIPERYAKQGPDAETQGSGDAGDRVACGVVGSG